MSDSLIFMRPERIAAVIIAAFAGCFAGAMAYLISYQEYLHHFPDKRKPRKMALEMALIAFSFFFGVGLILAAILPAAQ